MLVHCTTAHRRNMRLVCMEHVSVNAAPTDDCNNCWVCKRRNFSPAKVCLGCRAPTTPTRRMNGQELVYRIYSFGCNSRRFPSNERLREVWFDSAVDVLAANLLVAVRVGSDYEYAILIKDEDGTIRSYSQTGALGTRWNIGQAEFVRVSRMIPISQTDRTAGKNSLFNCMICSIQVYYSGSPSMTI